MSRWIKATKRLPDNDAYVLTYGYELSSDYHIRINKFLMRKQVWIFGPDVSHWMELPKAPRVKKKKAGISESKNQL